MRNKIKKFLKTVFKLVGMACVAVAGVLILCGLPFDEIKEKIQKKFN